MMPDTMTSQRIKPLPAVRLGSSSTDGEDGAYLQYLYYPITTGYYPSGHYLSLDIASYLAAMPLFIETETYKDRGVVVEEMIEHDIYVQMLPKRKIAVAARVMGIRKAVPRIVVPENPYFEP